jgi:hypothetical protein
VTEDSTTTQKKKEKSRPKEKPSSASHTPRASDDPLNTSMDLTRVVHITQVDRLEAMRDGLKLTCCGFSRISENTRRCNCTWRCAHTSRTSSSISRTCNHPRHTDSSDQTRC